MATLADLLVKVGIDSSGLTKGLQNVSADFKALDKDMRATERAFAGFEKIGDRLTGVGTALTVGLTAPIVAAGLAGATLGSQFDLGIGKVASLMQGVTDGEIKNLRQGVLDLAKSLGIDAVGGTEALYEAISAGVPKENAIEFLSIASKAAIAGVTDTKVAVDGLTSVLNAYHLPASQAAQVSDAMFQAVNVGKFTFDQLAASISIATPLAAQLGIGFQDIFAAASTLTSQGFSVSEAMNSIRQSMVALVKPNGDMNALIQKAGFESGEAMIRALGLHGALDKVREAAGGNVSVMTEAFGRVEALGAALGLTGSNAQTAAGHLDTVRNSAGSTEQAFAKITDTNAMKWDQVVNKVEAVAIKFGDALAPAISTVLDAATPLIEKLSSAVAWFTSLPEPVRNAALAFGAVAAAIGPLLMVAGSLIGSVTTLAPLFTGLFGPITAASGAAGAGALTFGALASVASGVGVAIAGLAAAWALWKYQDDLPGIIALKAAFGFLYDVVSLQWELFKSFAATVSDLVRPALNSLWESAGQLWEGFKSLASTVGEGVSAAFLGLQQALGMLTPAFDLVKGSASLLWETSLLLFEALKAIGGTIVDVLIGAFNAVSGVIAAVFNPAFDLAKTIVLAMASGISTLLRPAFDAIMPVIQSIAQWFGTLGEKAQLLADTVKDLREKFTGSKQPTEDLSDAVKDLNDKAKPLHEQFGVVIEKTKGITTEAPKAAKQITKIGKETELTKKEIAEANKEYEAYKKHLRDIQPKNDTLISALRILQTEHDKTKQRVADYNAKLLLGRLETVDFKGELDKLNDRLGDSARFYTDIANIKLPAVVSAMNQLTPPADKFKEALKQLGITGSADLQKVRDEAAAARDVVLGSNLATDFEKKTAIYKALKAQVEAAVQMGQDVPKETQEALRKMEDEFKTGKGQSVVTESRGMFTQISTVITNWAQDAGKILFDGDLSWGEKAKKMWSGLLSALTSTFIEPATALLNNFISGVLSDLLGGKGFGGILTHLKDIGSGVSDIFGGAGSAAGGAAGAGTGGSVPSGGGGAGSAASGVTGIVSAVAQVVSAATSVIQAFQLHGIGNDTGKIEVNTRESKIMLKELIERGQNQFLAEIPNIRGLFQQLIDHHASRIHDVWDRIGEANGFLDRIATAVEVPAAALAVTGGAATTVIINNPTFANRSDIDYAANQISRSLR